MEIFIADYNPDWPTQFLAIKDELTGDLEDEGVSFICIEHIGSTSVPDLPAKPIIDILIVVPASDFDSVHLEQFKEALCWGKRQGGYHFIGDGGVTGRWSFKLWEVEPVRHVYVVADGGLPLRNCLALRDTLRRHPELREEYANLKIKLAEHEYDNVMQYSTLKNPVIRKILRGAGWNETHIDEKEAQSVKDFPNTWHVISKRSWWDRFVDGLSTIICAISRILTCFRTSHTHTMVDMDVECGKAASDADSDVLDW